MKNDQSNQLEQLETELEPLHKVLPAGGPLVSAVWTCPECGYSQPGGPPPECQAWTVPDDCPLGVA